MKKRQQLLFSVVMAMMLSAGVSWAQTAKGSAKSDVDSAAAQEDAIADSPVVPEETVVESFGPGDSPAISGAYRKTTANGDTFSVGSGGSSSGGGYVDTGSGLYTIVPGDTLWDICSKLMGDPYYWPKLWSLNQYITNPHLIYPGNQLKFFAGGETVPPRLDVVDGKQSATVGETDFVVERAAATSAKVVDGQPLKVRPITFMAEGPLKVLGKISHSGIQKLRLTYGETVYLSFYDKANVSIGQKFHIVEKISSIKVPGRKYKELGKMVRKSATIEVTKILEKTVEAAIIDGDYAVERSYEFIAHTPLIKTIVPNSRESDVAGKILIGENQQFLISNNDYIVISLGAKDGIEPGRRLYVVKSGDGLFKEDDDHLPDVTIGRLLVVDAYKRSALAYVIDASESLEVGYRVNGKKSR